MQQGFFLQGVTLDQFVEALRPVLRHELEQLQQVTPSAVSVAEEMLTIEAAAAMLDISKATLFEWLRRGILSKVKIGGRSYIQRSQILTAGSVERRSSKPARIKKS